MKECVGKIISNSAVAEGIFELVIFCEALKDQQIQPGMFAQLEIPDSKDLILRRPISINSFSKEKLLLTFVYQIKGEGTLRLSRQKDGDIRLTTPLGKGFNLPEKSSKIMLIGAGIGLAPLRFIPEFAPQNRYYTLAGFRTKELAYQLDVFGSLSEKLLMTSDDGTLGIKGYIGQCAGQFMEDVKPDLILTCGPEIVLRQVKELARNAGIPCQLSMEARMGCGTGACMVCNVRIGTEDNWHYKRCCADGPVFDAQEVLF